MRSTNLVVRKNGEDQLEVASPPTMKASESRSKFPTASIDFKVAEGSSQHREDDLASEEDAELVVTDKKQRDPPKRSDLSLDSEIVQVKQDKEHDDRMKVGGLQLAERLRSQKPTPDRTSKHGDKAPAGSSSPLREATA